MAQRLLLVLRRQPVAFLALFVALSGSSYAAVSAGKAGQGDVIVGCVGDKDGKLRVVTSASRCASKETAISFNREGKQGAPGKPGANGAGGAAGSDGTDGVDGKDGAPGRDGVDTSGGVPGPAGTAGPAGPAGSVGATGVAGPAGAVGATGSAGATGATGAAGPAGPTGATGATGPAGATETASSLLTKLLTVDGTGSGLDADRLNGLSSSSFLRTTDFNSTFDARLGLLFGGGNQTAVAGASGGGVDCWMGDLSLTARDYPSPGTMFAAGQPLAISQYSAMYALLGTTYGGNGTTYFQLPDLRKQAPGRSTYEICVEGAFPVRP
jgi:hypothetical protein